MESKIKKYITSIVLIIAFFLLVLTNKIIDFIPKNILFFLFCASFIYILFLIYKIIATQKQEIEMISQDYLERKRVSINPENYKKYLKRKINTIQAMLITKAEKGLKRDHELENKLKMLEKERNKN